ncbi:hypothetical protein STRIC_1835 [Streptococcus ictaluri 707-05]|uniref:Sensor histidine kinase NatK-like C-terminal domain-containing protein n=1 Tax=Streptococcus ictaluri 707-05 TaxID=764299 RepID=G5K4U8_9STRE|nr:hypothetical protein STRIC_1835 [Streptococcus ictaluri 707-05]
MGWKKGLLIGFIFSAINIAIGNLVLIDQAFFIVLSFLYALHKKIFEHIFNGLFSIMIVELLFRTIGSFFLLAVIGYTVSQINNNLALTGLCYLLALPAFYMFAYIFSIDLSLIKFIREDQLKKWVTWMNISMVFYYMLIHFFVYAQSDILKMYFRYRSILIVIYLALFMWVIIKLDRFAKDQLSQQLDLAQQERISYLENYNHYIEQLYREIRTVKHDSENILISLKDSIDSADLDEITKVYQTVVQKSASSIKEIGFEISTLDNISEPVIRGLLSSKLLAAQNCGIDLFVEIPDIIEEVPIKLLDFVALLTVVLDNAIASAKGSKRPFLSIAYFKQDQKQCFIIENSTKPNRIDIAKKFDWNKADDSEAYQKCLRHFLTILDSYSQVTFSTKSDHYRLRQMLEMR